jgi:hypothetical protein
MHDLTRSHPFRRGLEFLEQRFIGLQFIIRHVNDDHAEREHSEIVFPLQLPVDHDENIEILLGKL